MCTKKQWTGKEKPTIVLQGLKGDCSVSALCDDHGITQGMYYKWRDQLLSDEAKLFERGGVDHARERLEHENRKLKVPRNTVTHKPRTIEPNRYWRIDMTKVMIPFFGWFYLHVVIDWGTKKLLSTHMSLTSKSADWIAALNEAHLFRSWSVIMVANRLRQPSSKPVQSLISVKHSPVTATSGAMLIPIGLSPPSRRISFGQKNLRLWLNLKPR